MFCANCGTTLLDGAKFCPSCGHRLTPLPEIVQPREPNAIHTEQGSSRVWFERKRRRVKRFKIIWLCLFGIDLLLPLLQAPAAFALATAAQLAVSLAYCLCCGFFLRSVKDLEQTGRMELLDDIPTDAPTFAKSRAYCGKRAMYLKGCHQVVAYSDIDWVYIRENTASWHGLQIYHSKTAELFGRRHISTKLDTEELKMLLGGYVAPVQRELLVGYTPGNRAEYVRRRRMRGGA